MLVFDYDRNFCMCEYDIENVSALDLGCGSGLHSLSLARMGFAVRSVDISNTLLEEMQRHAQEMGLHVSSVHSDFMNFSKWRKKSDSFAIISCMGDTLSHLGSIQEVQALFVSLRPLIKTDGALLLSFRDQSIELDGPERCIPVRSCPTRIHTCFLEFENLYITVNDIFQEYNKDTATWMQVAGSFRKLRLSTGMVVEALVMTRYNVLPQAVVNGMTYIAATPSLDFADVAAISSSTS